MQPKVEQDVILGVAEIGTFAGTRIRGDGVTEKVIVDDIVTSGKLTSPPDIENVVSLGAVRVTTHESVNYTPHKIGENRLRTFENVIWTTQERLTPIVAAEPKKA